MVFAQRLESFGKFGIPVCLCGYIVPMLLSQVSAFTSQQNYVLTISVWRNRAAAIQEIRSKLRRSIHYFFAQSNVPTILHIYLNEKFLESVPLFNGCATATAGKYKVHAKRTFQFENMLLNVIARNYSKFLKTEFAHQKQQLIEMV